MIEVGDMILYELSGHPEKTDVGWIIRVDLHDKDEGSAYLLHVKWMDEAGTHMIWDHYLTLNKEFTLIKGE